MNSLGNSLGPRDVTTIVSELYTGWLFSEMYTRCFKNVFVVAKRYILLDVAKKHIEIGCEKA